MLSLRPSTGCEYVSHKWVVWLRAVCHRCFLVYLSDWFNIVSSEAMIYNWSIRAPVEKVEVQNLQITYVIKLSFRSEGVLFCWTQKSKKNCAKWKGCVFVRAFLGGNHLCWHSRVCILSVHRDLVCTCCQTHTQTLTHTHTRWKSVDSMASFIRCAHSCSVH